MNKYPHYVTGFFAHRDDAERTLSVLIEQGLSREQINIYSPTASSPEQEEKSDSVLQNILVDGAVGTAVGTGVGALGSVALAASSVTLFIASPVVAPLMLVGWGASIGGLIGASVGAEESEDNKKEGWLADLIGDAIANGHVALVVETQNEEETLKARKIVQASVDEYKEE